MRRRKLLGVAVLMLLVSVLLAGCGGGGGKKSLETVISDRAYAYIKRAAAFDIKGLRKFYSKDFFIPEDELNEEQIETLSQFRYEPQDVDYDLMMTILRHYAELVPIAPKLEIVSFNCKLLTGEPLVVAQVEVVTIISGFPEDPDVSKYTQTWKNEGGVWRIVSQDFL